MKKLTRRELFKGAGAAGIGGSALVVGIGAGSRIKKSYSSSYPQWTPTIISFADLPYAEFEDAYWQHDCRICGERLEKDMVLVWLPGIARPDLFASSRGMWKRCCSGECTQMAIVQWRKALEI